MIQSRIRSKVLWVGILSQVGTILLLTGVVGQEGWTMIEGVVMAGLQILNIIGIINNPTDPVKW